MESASNRNFETVEIGRQKKVQEDSFHDVNSNIFDAYSLPAKKEKRDGIRKSG